MNKNSGRETVNKLLKDNKKMGNVINSFYLYYK
jgi:hypothetical protein